MIDRESITIRLQAVLEGRLWSGADATTEVARTYYVGDKPNKGQLRWQHKWPGLHNALAAFIGPDKQDFEFCRIAEALITVEYEVPRAKGVRVIRTFWYANKTSHTIRHLFTREGH